MKFSGENVILRGIFHVVSRFPLHFMFYRGNFDYFLDSVQRNSTITFLVLIDLMLDRWHLFCPSVFGLRCLGIMTGGKASTGICSEAELLLLKPYQQQSD